jgi:hypothetical protein
MLLFKVLTFIVVGLLTLRMVKSMLSVLHVASVQVKAERQRTPAKKGVRLTRDPRTGVYYPET